MRAISESCSSVQAANQGTPCRRPGATGSPACCLHSLMLSRRRIAVPRVVRVRAGHPIWGSIRRDTGAPEAKSLPGDAFPRRGRCPRVERGARRLRGPQPPRHAPEQRVAEAGMSAMAENSRDR